MEIRLIEESEKDLAYWQKKHNTKTLKRISELVAAILENPKTGIGNPEQLRYGLSGYWSRRIDKENRIVYRIDTDNDIIWIVSLKGHYQ